MYNYMQECDKVLKKLRNEKIILQQDLKDLTKQLNNLKVEKMQIEGMRAASNKHRNVPTKTNTKPVETKNISLDNQSEINNIPLSLNATVVLKHMLRGQITGFKNDETEVDDD